MPEKYDILGEQEKIFQSEGWKIFQKIDSLKLSFSIFQTNYQELDKLLKAYSTNYDLVISLMDVKNRQGQDAYYKEVTRLLHNFLSSVKSLVDHTRVFCEMEYKENDFLAIYRAKVQEEFASKPLVKFVQDLRNYALHKKLPIAGSQFNFSVHSGTSHYITLDINDLRDWDKWSAKSKEYIAGLKGTTNLKDIVDDYFQTTVSFYSWFGDSQAEIHQKELGELSVMQQRHQAELTKMNYSTDK